MEMEKHYQLNYINHLFVNQSEGRELIKDRNRGIIVPTLLNILPKVHLSESHNTNHKSRKK